MRGGDDDGADDDEDDDGDARTPALIHRDACARRRFEGKGENVWKEKPRSLGHLLHRRGQSVRRGWKKRGEWLPRDIGTRSERDRVKRATKATLIRSTHLLQPTPLISVSLLDKINAINAYGPELREYYRDD